MRGFSQAQIFLIFWIIGVVLGITYDFFRSIRKNFKISDFYTHIQDLIYCSVAGITIIKTILFVNNGQIRMYILMALILGGIMYLLTLSNVCITLFNLIFKLPRKMLFLKKYLKKNKSKNRGFLERM